MLYKVKIETELIVVAKNSKEAINIAKKNAPNEVANYGKGVATVINKASEIPDDWKNVIPYALEGAQEVKKCIELVPTQETKAGLEDDEINHIIKLQEAKKSIVEIDKSIKPETRPDPVPPKLDWHESKSGRPLQKLRFIK